MAFDHNTSPECRTFGNVGRPKKTSQTFGVCEVAVYFLGEILFGHCRSPAESEREQESEVLRML